MRYKYLMRSWVFASVAVVIAACSGGGEGGSSSNAKPTGFLKAVLPSIPANSTTVLSRGVSPLSVNTDYNFRIAQGLYENTVNNNTADTCTGSTSNIPFVLCMIELFGVGSVGTYNATNTDGHAIVVNVTEISGDPDGYTLKVVITNTTKSQVVFKYRANAEGTKGVIEAKPDYIFGGNSNADQSPWGFSLTWDSTTPAAQTLVFVSQSYSTDTGNRTGAGAMISYLSARVNSVEGLADIASFENSAVMSSPPDHLIRAQLTQVRIKNGLQVFTAAKCTETTTNGINLGCMTFDSTHYPIASNQVFCGQFNSEVAGLNVTETGSFSNAYGSYALSAFTNPDCEAVKTATSSPFVMRLDKASSDSTVLGDLIFSARNQAWSALDLFGNSAWLSAD